MEELPAPAVIVVDRLFPGPARNEDVSLSGPVFEHSAEQESLNLESAQMTDCSLVFDFFDLSTESVDVELVFESSGGDVLSHDYAVTLGSFKRETADLQISKTEREDGEKVTSPSESSQEARKAEHLANLKSTTNYKDQHQRTPFQLADRDQLRAMIVVLNESNSMLLKIRQRFPLSAPMRCDVIQRQIQMQLQELFGEFRGNDVNVFRERMPENRQTFLLIWDHLAQLIVDLCYHD